MTEVPEDSTRYLVVLTKEPPTTQHMLQRCIRAAWLMVTRRKIIKSSIRKVMATSPETLVF